MIEFPKPTVEQFFTSYNIDSFSASPDGEKLFFSTNLNGKVNIWAMDTNDRFPYLFAEKNESTNFVKYDPDGRFVLAGYDNDGDENYQIYAIAPDGGMPQPLITGEADEKYFFAKLSKDGSKIYYNTSKGNENYLNSCVYNLDTGEHEIILEGEESATFISDVSPDEKSVAYIKFLANTYALGMVQKDGEIHYVTPEKETVHTVFNLEFVNNDEIWFDTNYDSEYSYLAKYNLTYGKFTKVMDFGQESITDLEFNKNKNKLYIVTEKGVVDKLYYYDLETQTSDQIPTPFENIGSIAPVNNGDIFVLGGSANEPFNIWRYTASRFLKLTKNQVLGVTAEQMVDPENNYLQII